MANYAGRDDMVRVCAMVAGLDTDLTDVLTKATEILNRDITRLWYRRQCDERGVDWASTAFDQDKLVDVSVLADVATFKALELAGDQLTQHPGTKDGRDQWQEIRDHFGNRYQEELEAVLDYGLEYEWSASDNEIATVPSRRLRRM